jgi:hypothetical protein
LLSGLVAASAACGPMAFFAIMKSVFKKRRKGKDRTGKILPLLKRKRKQL